MQKSMGQALKRKIYVNKHHFLNVKIFKNYIIGKHIILLTHLESVHKGFFAFHTTMSKHFQYFAMFYFSFSEVSHNYTMALIGR